MTATTTVAPWEGIEPDHRKQLIWGLWFVTWGLFLVGLWDRRFWAFATYFSGIHALFALAMLRFRFAAFPAQVRVAFFVLVAIGTFVPHMSTLIYMGMVGLTTNLFVSYCPLARALTLLPWNRDEAFSLGLLRRVFLSAPQPGRFQPQPPTSR